MGIVLAPVVLCKKAKSVSFDDSLILISKHVIMSVLHHLLPASSGSRVFNIKGLLRH